jgi:hypothetical protein
MLTQSQIQAIRDHVALDERTQELIRLATADLYHGPYANEDENYPGFVPACHMIRDAFEATDLYLDTEIGEVIGDSEPSYDLDDDRSYSPETVLHLDSRDVVRALVGSELARYV